MIPHTVDSYYFYSTDIFYDFTARYKIKMFIIHVSRRCYSVDNVVINRMTTRVITLWRVYVTRLTTSLSTMCFLLDILSILKAKESTFKVM